MCINNSMEDKELKDGRWNWWGLVEEEEEEDGDTDDE